MSILQMNLYGSLLIIFTIIIRAVAMNKLPKKTFVALWLIIITRLLIPYTMPRIINVYPVVDKINEVSGERFINNQVIQPQEVVTQSNFSDILQTENMPAKEKTDILIYMIVWVAGIFAAGAFFIQPHILYSRKYRAALPVENDYIDSWVNSHRLRRKYKVMLSDEIISPFTYGVIKPIIVLPKTIDMNNREIIDYILTHEYIHIKRFDIVLKWISAITLCVNWFNPLVWVMYILMNRDIELSCDDGVIRLKGEINKKSYALTLLDIETNKINFNPLVNYFNKNSLKERMTAIMKTKKITILSIILAFVLIISSGLILSSSCKETVIIAGKEYSVDITRLDLYSRNLTDDDIKDIGKLKNLIVLDLDFNNITDVSVLSGLTNLQELHLSVNEISDISPLENLNNLTWLGLTSNNIRDISALSGLIDLEELYLANDRISDINPLTGLINLRILGLGANQIKDISALSGLTSLEMADFSGNNVNDISALANLINLTHLGFFDNKVKDISVISGLINLEAVNSYGNPITDWSPVEDMPEWGYN